MKKLKLFLLLFTLSILIWNCKKDKEESFVDGYIPNLTEEAGKEYTGDYFPMEVGYNWNWSGTASTQGQMNVQLLGSYPLNEDNVYTYGYMWVQDEVNLDLGSGNYDLLKTSETDGLVRYFEKKNNAVYMRAMESGSSSSIIEVKDPVYLKSPLVVGDKWETHPQADYDKLVSEQAGLTDADVDVDMKCMFYVVGKENIDLDGANVETLRLDQRAEVNGTLTSLEGNMTFNIKMTIHLNLQEDVGIVSQWQEMDMVMNGSFGDSGVSIAMDMNMNVESELTLDSFYSGDVSGGSFKKIETKGGRVISGGGSAKAYYDVMMEIVELTKKTSL